MTEFEENVQRMVKDVEHLLSRKLPVAAGKIAKQHFQENFLKGGFVNGGLHPWQPSKRLSSGGPGADSHYPTLLSSRKHLFSSIGYTPGHAKVTVFNDVIYAPIHNEGGTITVPVTARMRRFAWAKYYSLGGGRNGAQEGREGSKNANPDEAGKWKGLALTKKQALTINMPRRQFMGDSAELTEKIAEYLEKELLKIVNQ